MSLYDNLFPTEQTIIGGSGDYVLNGIPFDTFGLGMLRVTVTADVKRTSGGVVMSSGIADPGAGDIDLATGVVAFQAPATLPTTVYANYAFLDQTTFDPFSLFMGTGTAKSIYFHGPFLFPGPAGNFKIRNIHVVVDGVGPPPPPVRARGGFGAGPFG